MYQHPIAHLQDGSVAALPLGNQGIASEGDIAVAESVLFRNVSDHAAALEGFFSEHPLLRANWQIGVKQSADANDDNGRMREDVAELIGSALLCAQQNSAVFRDLPYLITGSSDLFYVFTRQLVDRTRR